MNQVFKPISIFFFLSKIEFSNQFLLVIKQAFEWVKNPLPLATAGNAGGPLACPTLTQQSCRTKTCTYDETGGELSPGGGLRGGGKIVSCSQYCPDRYPWTCNPQGIDPRPDVCDEGV